MKNETHCPCCGQLRPYPLEPGEWEVCEYPTRIDANWIRVSVKESITEFNHDGEPYLEVWCNGRPVWWPQNSAWRKVK